MYNSPSEWPDWTDDFVFVPSEEDEGWASEHLNEDNGAIPFDPDADPDTVDWQFHPIEDDGDRDAEDAYWQEQERRHAADPTEDEIAEWSDDPDPDDPSWDQRAAESAWLDAYCRGISGL